MKIKGIHAAPALAIAVSALIFAADYPDISKISGNINPYLTVMALEIACMGLPAVFFCILRGNEYNERLQLKIIRVRHISLSFYGLGMMICGGIALSLLMYRLFPEGFAASAHAGLPGADGITGNPDTVYAALAFGILPALLEEFLFRGVILTEYTPYGAATAVFFSSLLFALLHFTPIRLPIYFFTGIVLALITASCGSVLPAALVHSAYNVFILYFEKYIYKIAAKQSGGMIMLTFLVVTLLLIFAILFFGRAERLYRLRGEANLPSPLRRKKKTGDIPGFLAALLSPSFLILFVFYLAVVFFF